MADTLENSIGERLATALFHFKMSKAAIAKKVGVSASAIGDIINGETLDPRVSLIKNIALELDIRLDWLLLGEGEMLKSSISISQSNTSGDNLQGRNVSQRKGNDGEDDEKRTMRNKIMELQEEIIRLLKGNNNAQFYGLSSN